MGSGESVKAASDVYAPVSGTVTAVNSALGDNPAMVNASPEKDAWFVKLAVTDAAVAEATGALMGAAAYAKHVKESAH